MSILSSMELPQRNAKDNTPKAPTLDAEITTDGSKVSMTFDLAKLREENIKHSSKGGKPYFSAAARGNVNVEYQDENGETVRVQLGINGVPTVYLNAA